MAREDRASELAVIALVQPFGLQSPGGGPRIFRTLLAGTPGEAISVCTAPAAPPDAGGFTEIHVPSRPLFPPLEVGATQRLSGLADLAWASTFRRTLVALLLEPLDLHLSAPEKLAPQSRDQLTTWLRNHLSVSLVSYPDRRTLNELEKRVLRSLDPPLNLQHMEVSPVRTALSALRSELRKTTPSASNQPDGSTKQGSARIAQHHQGASRPNRTLHKAMLTVLEGAGWLSLDETARRIAERDLYRKRNGGVATAAQVHARATGSGGRYAALFEVAEGRIRTR